MSVDPRYPIGKMSLPQKITAELRLEMIEQIAAAPQLLRDAVNGLSEAQFDTPYREGGWTVRQVVHHLPDSHLNAYIRVKLALTEESPMVKPYDETKWAELADSANTPAETSLCMLWCLHARWVNLLRSMSEADFQRTFRHPEYDGPRPLDYLLAVYAWHGRHHTAQITELRKRMGW